MDFATSLLSLVIHIADLQRPRIAESITVVSAAPSISTPVAVTVLGSEALALNPSPTVDDALRSVPGFSLFRRSSSRVANPTTQGVTLRGLAASGSSRALVLLDDVPLNDPVGGWIYWNRLPAAAIQEVAVGRGASGDIHGADALAGVVSLKAVRAPGVRVLGEGGTHSTARGSAYLGERRGDVGLFAAGEGFTTDGFILTAPESRGPVDTPAGSRHGSAHGAVDWARSGTQLDFRGSHFGESRRNGTPVQRNSTRVTLVSGTVANSRGWSARAYGQTQRYQQTFSAVDSTRTSERQTSAQDVRATVVGGAADWGWSDGSRSLSSSVSGKWVGAELADTSYTLAGVALPPAVRAPEHGILSAAAQAAVHRSRSSFGGGVRVEFWRSELEGSNDHLFVSPRLWGAYAATDALTLRVALQSGHRGPTINELYRPFRVGSVITQANSALGPESAHGIEGGASWHDRKFTFRALGFWSRVDDAIVNVTLSATGPTIIRERQNAARIHAAGVELEGEFRIAAGAALTAATSYTDSSFAAGPLEGRRVPQVPRWHHALGAYGTWRAIRLSGEWRFIGTQFDDDQNLFVLDTSSMIDARVGWLLRRGVEIFAAVENALDEEQDVGRTPLRTLGLPRTSRVGLRVTF
jgi:outer membrane receptor protein involved in Fe transport